MKLIGMNCDLMKQYIEFVADRLMLELGFTKVTTHTHTLSRAADANVAKLAQVCGDEKRRGTDVS